MPLTGKLHTGTGAAVSLSTVGIPATFKRLDVMANDNNSADAFIGGSTVASDGTTDAWVQLVPGKSWTTGVAGKGDLHSVDTSAVYIIAASSDLIHFVVYQ